MATAKRLRTDEAGAGLVDAFAALVSVEAKGRLEVAHDASTIPGSARSR